MCLDYKKGDSRVRIGKITGSCPEDQMSGQLQLSEEENMDFMENLNTEQRKAAEQTEGPLLILAGAGSGKTRVLTCRIAYMIQECKVAPWNILAITFTNKAAGEMRDRVNAAVGRFAGQVWVATFHSTCCRILRSHIDRLGYDRSFTIYDTDDSRQVIKEAVRQLELDPKIYKERGILARISAAKNEMIDPDGMMTDASSREEERIAEIYALYQRRLMQNNALDFDDLLLRTVELFRNEPDVLLSYQERFRYILIDEYQDTNTVQFELVRLLASRYGNLCVVGDDDQSIYKFRGANIHNILSFEKVFPGCSVIRLEQNYRSTKRILQAANEVIAHNHGRKRKTLWTENEEGDPVRFRQFPAGRDEAEFVIGEIAELTRTQGKPYSDFAVLYRTNAQSRLFEEKCISADIPYQIVGGVNFYSRKEIKDILAYLKTIDNGSDDLAVTRILNVPRRGIGQTTISRITEYAREKEMSVYAALLEADEIPGIGRSLVKIRSFTALISRFRAASAEYLNVRQLVEMILKETGYQEELEAEETDEARARLENIDEFISKAGDYEETAEGPSLSDFLQQVSLVADIDSVEEGTERILLMTLHAAKGLEFDTVYMTGMEENTFPSYMSIGTGSEEEIEEERRLCYVGMTRARKHLTLTAAQTRMVRGETHFHTASRFVSEIPAEMLDVGRDTTDTRNFINGGREYRRPYPASGHEPGRIGGYGTAAAQTKRKKTSIQGMREFRVTKADHLEYGIGDRVRHVKFGSGVVTDIQDGARDYEVTVLFDKAGLKRMFASFAKLQKE